MNKFDFIVHSYNKNKNTLFKKKPQQSLFCAFFNSNKHPEFNFLSNFHPVKIDCELGIFTCSEGLYHYQKFCYLPLGDKDFDLVQSFKHTNGQEAWDLSRQLSDRVNPAWSRMLAMEYALQCKFHDESLQKLLLATKNAYIVENSPCGHDAFWSDNGDGTGENMLGKMLMEIRLQLGGTGQVGRPELLESFYDGTCLECNNCCHFTNAGVSLVYCDLHKDWLLRPPTMGLV